MPLHSRPKFRLPATTRASGKRLTTYYEATRHQMRNAIAAAAPLVLLFIASAAGLAQERYDVVVRNGRVLDGTGNPWFRADIAVVGDRIAAVGDLSEVEAVDHGGRHPCTVVATAEHVYTATQSNLRAYAIPRWASAGGRQRMLPRFEDAEAVKRLDVETMEMLAIRGGPEKLLFTDARAELNGRTLAAVARDWGIPVPEAVRRILAERDADVMNLELYDMANTKYLAQQEWMMTCTDGWTPPFGEGITHPPVVRGLHEETPPLRARGAADQPSLRGARHDLARRAVFRSPGPGVTEGGVLCRCRGVG